MSGLRWDVQNELAAAQVLPDSLTDAIAQASESTVTAMAAGSNKIVVGNPSRSELMLPHVHRPFNQAATPQMHCACNWRLASTLTEPRAGDLTSLP